MQIKSSLFYVSLLLFAILCGFGGSYIINSKNSISFLSLNEKAASAVLTSASSHIKILVAGDIMMDRNVRKIAETQGYDAFFTDVSPLFHSADISIANLEGSITSYPSKSLIDGHTTKDLTFTFAPETAGTLARVGITALSLANNHSANFEPDGLLQTRDNLTKNGVQYFGDPSNSPGTEFVTTKDGITVAFVGYHEFSPGLPDIVNDVKRLSAEGDFVIVMPHWGTEYAAHPSELEEKIAKLFVDAGASAIIGSHPHVAEDRNWIGSVPVIYSVGNLLFDQYFSSAVMTGNIVELDLDKEASGTKLDDMKIYETSLSSRNKITVVPTPIEFKYRP